MGNEPQATASEWSLPLRRRADQLIREGRFEEAGRLLMHIRRVLRQEPSGGYNERPDRSNDHAPDHDIRNRIIA